MIFKTFDSDIDKISSKIGVFGKSFNNIIELYQKRDAEIEKLKKMAMRNPKSSNK